MISFNYLDHFRVKKTTLPPPVSIRFAKMSKQQTFQFEKQQKQLFVDANIGMKTNDREYTQTKAPVIQRAISKLLLAFLILTVVGSSLQSVPVAQAFSHTKYRTCSDKFRQQVAKRGCDFRRSYCGYVVVWIPRGGFEVSTKIFTQKLTK